MSLNRREFIEGVAIAAAPLTICAAASTGEEKRTDDKIPINPKHLPELIVKDGIVQNAKALWDAALSTERYIAERGWTPYWVREIKVWVHKDQAPVAGFTDVLYWGECCLRMEQVPRLHFASLYFEATTESIPVKDAIRTEQRLTLEPRPFPK